MAIWTHRKFLNNSTLLNATRLLVLLGCFPGCTQLFAQTNDQVDKQAAEQATYDPLEDIIAPDLDRPVVTIADIDSENWEFGLYAGAMSIEDFGTSTVSGFQVAYHISESFFAEAGYGTTEAGETSFETLSGSTQILTDDQRNLTYYDLSIGYNIFQGEIFIGSRHTYNANFYLTAGAGNTDFADDSYFTYSVGIGSRFFIRDWISVQGGLKAHSFSHELLGEEKNIINLEPRVGLTFFF